MGIGTRISLRISTAACLIGLMAAPAARAGAPFKILVYGAMNGDPAAKARNTINALLRTESASQGFSVDTSVESGVFTRDNLARYRVVVMNNSSDVAKGLDSTKRSAFMEYLQTHGHVGIHYAALTMGGWDEYARYLGADASSHVGATGTLRLDSTQTAASMHPIVRGLPSEAILSDSWLWFRNTHPGPRGLPGMEILYGLDESGCPTCPKSPGGDNEAVWARTLDSGGRMFYMAPGFNALLFEPNAFCSRLLLRAIQWAAGELDAPAGAKPERIGALPQIDYTLRPSGSGLQLDFSTPEPRTFTLSDLNGNTIATERSESKTVLAFSGQGRQGVFHLSVATRTGKSHRRVAWP